MSSVPQPYREAELFMHGADTLAQDVTNMEAARKKEAELNAPGDPDLDRLIQRLLDPSHPMDDIVKEFQNSPQMQAALKRLAQGAPAVPNLHAQVPDVAMVNGRPQVLPPGAVNPAGAPPNAPTQGLTAAPGQGQPAAPTAAPAQGQPSLGQPPAKPPAFVSGGLNMPPPVQRPSAISGGPVTYGGPPRGEIAQNAVAPATGPRASEFHTKAPLNTAPERPQPGSIPTTPGRMTTAVAPKGQPAAQSGEQPVPSFAQRPPQPHVRTVREQQRWMPVLPAMVAGGSRADVANVTTQGREQVALVRNLRAEVDSLLKDSNMSADRLLKAMGISENDDVRVQIAALQAAVSMANAQTGANARLGAAQFQANRPGEDPLWKVYKGLQADYGKLAATPGWLDNPENKPTMDYYRSSLTDIERRLGMNSTLNPRQPGAPVQPRKPGAPAPGPGPAAPSPAGPPAASGTIRVRSKKTGQTGNIPAANFDPAKYDRL